MAAASCWDWLIPAAEQQPNLGASDPGAFESGDAEFRILAVVLAHRRSPPPPHSRLPGAIFGSVHAVLGSLLAILVRRNDEGTKQHQNG